LPKPIQNQQKQPAQKQKVELQKEVKPEAKPSEPEVVVIPPEHVPQSQPEKNDSAQQSPSSQS
jgi:hypothetical protein